MPKDRSEVIRRKIADSYSVFSGKGEHHATISTNRDIMRWGVSGNYGYPDFHRMRKKNCGQNWRLDSHRVDYGVIDVGKIYGTGPHHNSWYEGALMDSFSPGSAWNQDFPPDAWGATAYNRMKPTQPDFSAINSLVELREAPALLQARCRDLKEISNFWVALQFGWKPLLSDIRKLVYLQRNGQKRLNQLMRDNGRPVRRRVQLLDTMDGPHITGMGFRDYPEPLLVTYFYHGNPRSSSRWYATDKVWASARFRYWLPPGPRDIAWKRAMIARIYGLYPSPSVVYNAIPWSWLNDWFSNTGDIIENMDSGVANRCAADYFYVMREKQYVAEQTTTVWLYGEDRQVKACTGTSRQVSTVKTRTAGDPFGFATNQNSLTGMQLSILGALGKSRL